VTKKIYPMMIYKGGLVSSRKEDYMVVYDYEQHMTMLEAWGDKRPDDLAMPVKKMEDTEKPANSDPSEVKPGHKTKTKKKASKKALKL